MAPAADMFEPRDRCPGASARTTFGIEVVASTQLYRVKLTSLDSVSERDKAWLEESIFGKVWRTPGSRPSCTGSERDPAQFQRAEENPKHKLALLFRSYLGLASRWAIEGRVERRSDYQIWCSSAMALSISWVVDRSLPRQRTAPSSRLPATSSRERQS